MRSVSTPANRLEKLPRPGLASVSWAPSDNASIAASPPSMQFVERISTRAFSARSSISGSAVMPFIPGISMSSTTTSTGSRARKASASCAEAIDAQTVRPSVWSMIRSRMLRTARLSSTSMTRTLRATGIGASAAPSRARGREAAPRRTSGDADELQFSFERFAVERLHHIFVGPRLDRGADMVDAVFGGAEYDTGAFFAPIVEIVERPQKFHTAHHRHVPVEQDHVGTIGAAKGQRLLPVRGLVD